MRHRIPGSLQNDQNFDLLFEFVYFIIYLLNYIYEAIKYINRHHNIIHSRVEERLSHWKTFNQPDSGISSPSTKDLSIPM